MRERLLTLRQMSTDNRRGQFCPDDEMVSNGILDYSNCCQVDYGDYSLNFPTSRALALDKGQGMTDKGELNQTSLIPWTVESIWSGMWIWSAV